LVRLALYNTISRRNLRRVRDSYKLVICAAGTDRRAYESIRMTFGQIAIDSSLILEFSERTKSVKTAQDLTRYREYEHLLPGATALECSLMDRNCAMRRVSQVLEHLGPDDSVLVDLSVFTKPYLFALLRALQKVPGLHSVDILYTEPSYYKKNRTSRWSTTKQPYDVIEIPGFAGRSSESNKRLLVMLLGSDGGESRWVYEDQAPTVTIPVNGFPSYLLYYKDVSMLSNSFLFDEQTVRANLDFAPAYNPFGTYNALDAIRKRFPFDQFAMTIAALGPKPMALGAALFALHYADVRVVYPLPSRYAMKIGDDVGRTWLYRVPIAPGPR